MILDTANGHQLQEFKGAQFLYRDGDGLFSVNHSLDLRSPTKDEVQWESDVAGSSFYLQPVFTDELVLIRKGRVRGELIALERRSGRLLWSTDQTLISNVALSKKQNAAFGLSSEGQLLQLDLRDGAAATLGQFTDPPFVLNGEAVVGGYELAFDEKSGSLLVLLGDSRQLFGVAVR